MGRIGNLVERLRSLRRAPTSRPGGITAMGRSATQLHSTRLILPEDIGLKGRPGSITPMGAMQPSGRPGEITSMGGTAPQLHSSQLILPGQNAANAGGGNLIVLGAGGPTIRDPGGRRPTSVGFTGDMGEIWPHYPKRGFMYHALPIAAMPALAAYWTFRAGTVVAMAMTPEYREALPFATALFAAESHAIAHGFGFQLDALAESKYERQKRANWPTNQEIMEVLGPRGQRTMIEVASANEEPMTVRPTLEGALELEGNKQVVWCSQAKVGKIYPDKLELVNSINTEYQAVWGHISNSVQTAVQGPVDTTGWNVNDGEFHDRNEVQGRWNASTPQEKRDALKEIYTMLGRRFITRGGLYIWSGTASRDIPSQLAMTEMARRVFTGELKDLGETPEVGLAREVDISQYQFVDANGIAHRYEGNLDVLAARIRGEMMTVTTAAEAPIYGFEHMRGLLSEDKNSTMADYAKRRLLEKLPSNAIEDLMTQVEDALEDGGVDAANRIVRKAISNNTFDITEGLAYFPKNVRKGGEDIKIGLEYEAKAAEVASLSDAELNEEFGRVVNTYANHQVVWWDRDRFADQDHGGKKAQSMNSLIHHVGGKWYKVQRSATAATFDAENNLGYTVAQDSYSALMRVCLENFENGQAVWDEISHNPQIQGLQNAVYEPTRQSLANIKHILNMALSQCRTKPRRWIVVSNFLSQLKARGPVTAATLKSTLEHESLIDGNVHPSNWNLRAYAGRIQRAANDQEKTKELKMFFDENLFGRKLVLEPNDHALTRMAIMTIRDTIIPPGYTITERYDFSNIRIFGNIDAEVNPRPEFIEQTVPFFLKKIQAARGSGKVPTILQTPQFYVVDPIRSDVIHIAAMKDSRLFYQKIQPAKAVHEASFSCGSNVEYDLAPLRKCGFLEFADPRANSAKQEPGGLRDNLIGAEVFRTDIWGNRRPINAYIVSYSPVEDFSTSLRQAAMNWYYMDPADVDISWTDYLDKVLGKGEAPIDIGNWQGAQSPKWGATQGDYFRGVIPMMLRGTPGVSRIARGMVKASRVWGIRNVIGAAKRLGTPINDAIEAESDIKNAMSLREIQNLPDPNDPRYLGDARYNSLRYRMYYAYEKAMSLPGINFISSKAHTALFNILGKAYTVPFRAATLARDIINETSLSTGPKLNPISWASYEFTRAGSWYMKGVRDQILLYAPSVYIAVSSLFGAGVLSNEHILHAATPMRAPIGTTMMFLSPALATSLGSYLYHENRSGRGPKQIMVQKEALLYTQGWPGSVDSTYWSMKGSSGRPGNITKKGASGTDPLPMHYNIAAKGTTVFNIGATAAGLASIHNGVDALGLADYIKVGGGGMAAVTFWSGYSGLLGAQGWRLGYGGPNVSPADVRRALEKKGYPMQFYTDGI